MTICVLLMCIAFELYALRITICAHGGANSEPQQGLSILFNYSLNVQFMNVSICVYVFVYVTHAVIVIYISTYYTRHIT